MLLIFNIHPHSLFSLSSILHYLSSSSFSLISRRRRPLLHRDTIAANRFSTLSATISTVYPSRKAYTYTVSPSSSVSNRDKMANPSSSHHDRDRDRERVRERSHHHHRTISSTTLLLTLSLILAVLAVMLSLPSNRGSVVSTTHPAEGASHQPSSFWNILTPRRTDTLVAREVAVAKRESDVARREAEILAGALVSCGPPYATVTEHIENFAPAQTIYKEIIKEREVPSPTEAALSAPVTADLTRRIEDLISRETKVAEREKDMSRREEIVNRREHDASRRENWIMEQLMYVFTSA